MFRDRKPHRCSRRQALAGGSAVVLSSLARPAFAGATEELPDLKELAAKKGVIFGTAMAQSELDDADLSGLIARQAGLLVSQSDHKLIRIAEHGPDEHNYERAERMMRFAESQKIAVRGHALIMSGETGVSPWMERVLPDQGAAPLEDYIRRTCKHFAGRLESWDVVNEAIERGPDLPTGYRESVFYRCLGPEFIRRAFEVSEEADPHSLKFYSDSFTFRNRSLEWHRVRRETMVALLEDLKAAGTPLDGLALHGHLSTDGFNIEEEAALIRDVGSIGLQVYISELDVNDTNFVGSVDERDAAVATVYKDYLDMALSFPHVTGVLTWGLSDRGSWIRRKWERSDASPQRPLPFADDLTAKPAFWAMVDAFENTSARPQWRGRG